MKQILDNLTSLGRTRLLILGGTGLGLMAALFFGVSTVMRPTFAPLYSELTPSGASQIVTTLEQAGFQVELSGGGSVVSVPQEDIPRARMALAAGGLPEDGVPGWELFDNASGLGMNSFMQRVTRLRALEGELARSIQTIEGIDAARVHLVLPEREAFSRNRPEPTASVIVRGRASSTISRRQGLAIRALVAAAVPDLDAARVTVLSASGETILGQEEGSAEVTLQSVRSSIEERMARNIEGILTARVGAGNARVQVSVDLNTERQVIVQKSFDPSQQVVRSTETREESVKDQDTRAPSVDVGNNLPEALAQNGAGGSNSSRATTDEIVNYEVGSTQSETVREPGGIDRVTVAVLVNGIYNVQSDGSVAYEERSAEELGRLSQLVQAAIGYDAQRGDAVSVDSLRFMDYSMDVGEPVGTSLGEVISANIMSILRGVFALLVVGLVLVLGVRPVTRLLLPPPGDNGKDADALGAEEQKALAGGGPRVSNVATLDSVDDDGFNGGPPSVVDMSGGQGGDLIQIASVQGGVSRLPLASLEDLVASDPDESLKVLQTWLAQEAS